MGSHDVKLGYEFRRTDVDAFFDAGYRGRLDFDSLADFLSGTLSGGRSARAIRSGKLFRIRTPLMSRTSGASTGI